MIYTFYCINEGDVATTFELMDLPDDIEARREACRLFATWDECVSIEVAAESGVCFVVGLDEGRDPGHQIPPTRPASSGTSSADQRDLP